MGYYSTIAGANTTAAPCAVSFFVRLFCGFLRMTLDFVGLVGITKSHYLNMCIGCLMCV